MRRVVTEAKEERDRSRKEGDMLKELVRMKDKAIED
jgi:hypothetical protein